MNIVEIGASSVQGPRTEMQDAMFYNASTIGVFDGHGAGGAYAAELTMRSVQSAASDSPTPIDRIKNLFTVVDPVSHKQRRVIKALSSSDRAINKDGGTTATVATFGNRGDTSIVGITWVGDSPAYLLDADGGSTVYRLTKPHDVTNAEEVERLRGKGIGIWNKHYFGMSAGKIMLSRSIGDPSYKNTELLATPESIVVAVKRPSLLVVASDGVLSTNTTSDVLSELRYLMARRNRPNLPTIAGQLTSKYARITDDNATAVLFRLDPS